MRYEPLSVLASRYGLTMVDISMDKLLALKANIYEAAHPAIDDWYAMDWHTDQSDVVDGDVPHSSQAFCMSVWGSLAGHAQAIGLGALRASADLGAEWEFLDGDHDLEFEFEDRSLLNEFGSPKATNVDVLLTFDGYVVAVESKLTEAFGGCGQVAKRKCSGDYQPGSDLKTGSDAPCRLQIQEGRRTPRKYWDVMSVLGESGAFPHETPCPFAGGSYQVIRNIAVAYELGLREGKDWRVIFAFPASSRHDSVGYVHRVVDRLRPEHRQRISIVDYDMVGSVFAASGDSDTSRLGSYMLDRLPLV